jgi:hypothetical protein
MTRLHTYLNFEGNAEETSNFYKSVFGGKISSLVRFRDLPTISCRGSTSVAGAFSGRGRRRSAVAPERNHLIQRVGVETDADTIEAPDWGKNYIRMPRTGSEATVRSISYSSVAALRGRAVKKGR